MRLFIADDSEILRERLVESISEIERVEIVGEEEGSTKAIEAVERLNPDLVIMDIKMPGGNGIFALEALKKKKTPPIIIMFTNYPYLQYRKKCMDMGADYFFYKATEFEKLISVIKKIVLTHIDSM